VKEEEEEEEKKEEEEGEKGGFAHTFTEGFNDPWECRCTGRLSF